MARPPLEDCFGARLVHTRTRESAPHRHAPPSPNDPPPPPLATAGGYRALHARRGTAKLRDARAVARALIEEESAVAIQRAARGRAARNERAVLATERDLRIEMAKRIQKAHRCMHAMALLIAKLAERARREERERSEAAASTMIQCSWRLHSIWKMLTRACQSVRRVALSLFCSFIFFALAMVQPV